MTTPCGCGAVGFRITFYDDGSIGQECLCGVTQEFDAGSDDPAIALTKALGMAAIMRTESVHLEAPAARAALVAIGQWSNARRWMRAALKAAK